MWIQNVSLSDIHQAWHYDPGPNNLLIRIVDPYMEFTPVKYPFNHALEFKFLDAEQGPHCITEIDANIIVAALMQASRRKTNVIVHCHAGICRSGAVAEFAISRLGFEDTGTYRQPNLLVKRMLNETFDQIIGDPNVNPYG